MAEPTNNTPDVVSSGLTVGRVYGGKAPALLTGTGGQLYADDRQVSKLTPTGPGATDYDVEFTNAAGGAPQKSTLAAFVDWADTDVTDLLPPSLPDTSGDTHVHWRPWASVGAAQHPAAKVNEHPDAATAAAQLAPVRIIDGNEADMGGTVMPDAAAASAAPAPAGAGTSDTTTSVGGAATGAANAASKAAGKTTNVGPKQTKAAAKKAADGLKPTPPPPAPAGPNVLVAVNGQPAPGTPAVVGGNPGPEGASNPPTPPAPGAPALSVDTASNDAGNTTGSQNEATANAMAAAQSGNVPGTTGGTAQAPVDAREQVQGH